MTAELARRATDAGRLAIDTEVMRAGRRDVAMLKRAWETDIQNVFDAQVAAGFLGYGVEEGYGSLVRKVLGIEPAGGEAFTHWDRRPLTDQQLEYARADAAHLLELGDALSDRLAEAGPTVCGLG